MSGQAGPPAGSWGILLAGSNGLRNLQFPTLPPCFSSFSTYQIGACWILQSSSNGFLSGVCTGGPNNGPSPGYSCNLSAASVGTPPVVTGAQLSGSVVATFDGEVSTVATLTTNVCGTAPAGCAFPNGFGFGSLTSSSNFPGSPIMVTTGQTIQVTVTISFGSGS
jgi:hypothetical protein